MSSARPNRWLASWGYEMIGRTEVVAGDVGWPRAEPLLPAVWSPEVVATLPWKDVVWAHADWRVLIFNSSEELIGHVGIFLRDAMWDARAVKVGGIGGVATREDCRRQGVASTGMRRASREMRDAHGVDFALLFCEQRHAPVYEKLGWQKFEGAVFVMQPQGRVRFGVTEPFILDVNLAPRNGVIDLCGLPW
ncbi:MAG TPA: GNAT family N-acetyltransferase [Acetobacteraceae bacterium]